MRVECLNIEDQICKMKMARTMLQSGYTHAFVKPSEITYFKPRNKNIPSKAVEIISLEFTPRKSA